MNVLWNSHECCITWIVDFIITSNKKKIGWKQFNSRTKFGLKTAYFLVHPNSGSWSQITWIFLQHVYIITKYLLPEKNSLLNSQQADIKRGEELLGPPPHPQPLRSAKVPGFQGIIRTLIVRFFTFFINLLWACSLVRTALTCRRSIICRKAGL